MASGLSFARRASSGAAAGLLGVGRGHRGLGIGGATAIFSVAEAVILRAVKRDQPVLAISYPAYKGLARPESAVRRAGGHGRTNQAWTPWPRITCASCAASES